MAVSVTFDRSAQLASYAGLVWECITGRRSAKLVLLGFLRRRIVRRWVARHAGEPFPCRMPSGGKLLLDPTHWFIENYYAGFGDFEPDLQRALTRMLRPGATFIDCGANAGFFSVFANDMLQGNGTVVAIEANPRLLEELNRNLEANSIPPPAIHRAIASRKGIVDFFVPSRVDVLGGMRPTAVIRDDEMSRISVPASTLDEIVAELGLERVDVVKIDIEGAELEALRSAEGTIERDRPVLLVEYNPTNWKQYGARHEDLEALCDRCRYRICRYDIARDAPVPVEPSFWESELANMVLIPEVAA